MQTLPAPSNDRDGYRASQVGGERDRCGTITGKRGLSSDREDRPATKKLSQGSAGGQHFTQQDPAVAPDGAQQAPEGKQHGASATGAAPAAACGEGLCGQPAAAKGPDMLLRDWQRELTGTPKGLKHSPGAQQLAPREAGDAPSGSQQAPEGFRHSAQQFAPGDAPEARAGPHLAQLSCTTSAALLPLIETICKAVCEELIQSMQRKLEAIAKG